MSADQHSESVVRGTAQIGNTIRRLREARGLDQAQLAEAADVHRSYLSKIENHTPADTLGRLLRILSALDAELVIRPRARPDG